MRDISDSAFSGLKICILWGVATLHIHLSALLIYIVNTQFLCSAVDPSSGSDACEACLLPRKLSLQPPGASASVFRITAWSPDPASKFTYVWSEMTLWLKALTLKA